MNDDAYVVESIPAGSEFSLIDDEKHVGKKMSQLYLDKKLLNQYNSRSRFFQNFEDNSILPNEILQTTGKRIYFSLARVCRKKKMMRNFRLIKFKWRKLPVWMVFAYEKLMRQEVKIFFSLVVRASMPYLLSSSLLIVHVFSSNWRLNLAL